MTSANRKADAEAMIEDALYRDPDLAQFYDAANGWGPDFDYCVALARNASSVLDLGCGTGELTAALSIGRHVTGVDPAGAMLDIARKRAGGDAVTWVEEDARTVRLGRRFDLVLLTGHAFQVFLTDDDQAAVLVSIAAHLGPGGRFIFDSRNPLLRTWEDPGRAGKRRIIEDRELGAVEALNESSYDDATGILSYVNGFRIAGTDRTFSAPAQIRYTAHEALARRIEQAGLVVDLWLGDWHGSPYRADSPEIIPIGRLA
jgi:SAM-dependent methyltransferase